MSRRNRLAQELIGKKFNKLTVIKYLGVQKGQNGKCRCLCECGNIVDVRTDRLKSGYRKSCGCHSRVKGPNKRLIGKTFGDLTIIGFTGDRVKANGVYICRCRCVCGNTIDLPHTDLTRKINPKTRCGCKTFFVGKTYTRQDYDRTAARLGWTWIGEYIPLDPSQLTYWMCDQGHVLHKSYKQAQNCRACRYCGKIKTATDYVKLATERGFTWLGPTPETIHLPTWWQCVEGHKWQASYSNIKYRRTGCTQCGGLYIRGALVSKPQLDLAKMLSVPDEWVNYREGSYTIDVVLLDDQIGIEYDGFPWHDVEKDALRDKCLIDAGWKILHVRSGTMLPTEDQLQAGINVLYSGKLVNEIILEDWAQHVKAANN